MWPPPFPPPSKHVFNWRDSLIFCCKSQNGEGAQKRPLRQRHLTTHPQPWAPRELADSSLVHEWDSLPPRWGLCKLYTILQCGSLTSPPPTRVHTHTQKDTHLDFKMQPKRPSSFPTISATLPRAPLSPSRHTPPCEMPASRKRGGSPPLPHAKPTLPTPLFEKKRDRNRPFK